MLGNQVGSSVVGKWEGIIVRRQVEISKDSPAVGAVGEFVKEM